MDKSKNSNALTVEGFCKELHAIFTPAHQITHSVSAVQNKIKKLLLKYDSAIDFETKVKVTTSVGEILLS